MSTAAYTRRTKESECTGESGLVTREGVGERRGRGGEGGGDDGKGRGERGRDKDSQGPIMPQVGGVQQGGRWSGREA